jgi:hypothetical protein
MTLRRLAILSATVVVLFAFIFFYERRLPTTQEQLDRGNTVWDMNPGQIARIQILRGSETLEFARRSDDSWKMVKPETYPADSSSLSSLVFDLSRPQSLGEAPEGASQPDYGLMAPRAVVTITGKARKDEEPASHTLSIGKEVPGTDTVAARVKGENRIVFLRATTATDVLKPADSYKSRRVFGGTEGDVTGISLLRGRGRLDFEKRQGQWWMSAPIADLADATSVSRLIGDLLEANAEEFLKVAAADLSGDGLHPPIYTVKVKSGEKVQTLEIGATRADGKSVYARANGQVFSLDSQITDELSKAADSFREKKLVRFDSAAVTSISASKGAETVQFTKSGTEWKTGDKTVPATAVTDFLTELAAQTSTGFASRTSTETAERTIKLDLSSGSPLLLKFFPRDARGLAVQVSGRPEALRIQPGDYDRLVESLAKIVPSAAPPGRPAQKPKKK